MKIRRPSSEDIPGIIALLDKMGVGFTYFDYDRLVKSPGYVAVEGDSVIGYVGGTVGAYGYLGPLAVDPSSSIGKFIGTKLVATMMRYFRLMGIFNIVAVSNNKQLIRICHLLGWQERDHDMSLLYVTLPEIKK